MLNFRQKSYQNFQKLWKMISALAREGHRKRAYVDRSLTAASYNVILKPYRRYGYI